MHDGRDEARPSKKQKKPLRPAGALIIAIQQNSELAVAPQHLRQRSPTRLLTRQARAERSRLLTLALVSERSQNLEARACTGPVRQRPARWPPSSVHQAKAQQAGFPHLVRSLRLLITLDLA